MTTQATANLYIAQHREGKGWAIFNPHNKPVNELPVIYGFNNGGSTGWLEGVLLAQDGTHLGGHICSNEGYMPHDLGILEGSRPDRHEGFRRHYPDGYRMEFVGYDAFRDHDALKAVVALANERHAEREAQS